MNKLEIQKQKYFEQQIELLITYKKMNPTETVYLNENSLKKALNWYNNFSNGLNNILK